MNTHPTRRAVLFAGAAAVIASRAAASICSKANSRPQVAGFTRAVTVVICGKAACSSSRRLPLSSVCIG